jgi:integrase/recombinase XerD
VNTIDAYRRDLADYEAYLKATEIDALKADTNHVRGFLTARGAQKLSAASLARRLSAIRQFHKFLYAEGWRRDNPTLAVEGPRRSRPLPKLLSLAEVERLIATAREGLDLAERPLRERLDAARVACRKR